MSAEVFAEFLKSQGCRVIHTSSSYWCELGIKIYQSFPYHWIIEPVRDELTEILDRSGAIGIRYSTPLQIQEGSISYHVAYEKSVYPLDALHKSARYDVRKGFSYARVEPISFSRLADEGWKLREETLKRQGRKGAETREWWRKLCLGAADLPGFETWGALHDNQLVAALIAFTCDQCCSILYHQSLSDHLKFGINNALTYTFTAEALKRPSILSMFYGLHSLDAPASVDEFKFRMGYEAKPVRQRVVFHPRIEPLFNPTTYRGLRRLHEVAPVNHLLAKAEGMVRFYLQGKLPLEEQTWPEALVDRKAEILAKLAPNNPVDGLADDQDRGSRQSIQGDVAE